MWTHGPALFGALKDTILSFPLSGVAGQAFETEPLAPEIAAIAEGSYQRREPREIRGTGCVVHSLEAARWAFYWNDSFRNGCLLAVNLDDAPFERRSGSAWRSCPWSAPRSESRCGTTIGFRTRALAPESLSRRHGRRDGKGC